MSIEAFKARKDVLEDVALAEGVSRVLFVTSLVDIPLAQPVDLEAPTTGVSKYRSITGFNIRQRLGLVE